MNSVSKDTFLFVDGAEDIIAPNRIIFLFIAASLSTVKFLNETTISNQIYNEQ